MADVPEGLADALAHVVPANQVAWSAAFLTDTFFPAHDAEVAAKVLRDAAIDLRNQAAQIERKARP